MSRTSLLVMPRRRSSLGRTNYVVRSSVTNPVGRSNVLFGRRDTFYSIELAIVSLDVVALFLVAAVPVARNFSSQLAIAESEGK